MIKVVHREVVIRFGQWMAGEEGAYQPDALKLIEAARNESGIIGARIAGAIDNSDSQFREGLMEKMKASFSEEEINHILSIERNGPYEWH